MLLVTLQGTHFHLTWSPHLVSPCAPNKIGYGKIGYAQMKQSNNILQFPQVRAEKLFEKSKP